MIESVGSQRETLRGELSGERRVERTVTVVSWELSVRETWRLGDGETWRLGDGES